MKIVFDLSTLLIQYFGRKKERKEKKPNRFFNSLIVLLCFL